MSNTISVQEFLIGKSFHIPPYQRDYAWTTSQVDDLFSDIREALETRSDHYLGTIVLSRNSGSSYEIVDGQQRLSTLALIIQALLKQLDPSDSDYITDDRILLRNGSTLKLDCGNNASFLQELLGGGLPSPTTAGQRKLREAYEFAEGRARAIVDEGGVSSIKEWIATIKSLQIIQFVADDLGGAIRMFQTVNDRGLPLKAMDKAKALLVYHSNRYLSGSLDEEISLAFGDCFSAFDSLRQFATTPDYRIDNIARESFTEDDLLRYHYLAYYHPLAEGVGDFSGSLRTVFDGFLKGSLKQLSHQPDNLRAFVQDYISDLRLFARSFEKLVAATATDPRLYRLLVILGLAARLFPLAIRLHQRGLLQTQVPNTSIDLLHCLEVCDVRVYKTRGTDPAKDIGALSHSSRTATVQCIADRLRDFLNGFMPDGLFQGYLSQDMFNNEALTHFLLYINEKDADAALGHSDLLQMVRERITREHIIAQTPNWATASQGFHDEADFNNHLHMFGNLTLLSRSENSKCQNKPAHTKMTDPEFYLSSWYKVTRDLAHKYGHRVNPFTKGDICRRTQDLTADVVEKWAIW